jgi:ABC-type lipoprotein release transport system permease subunit
MAALRIRLRAQVRSRWRAWLAIGVLAGLLGGIVIAGAAGAKRTQGSYRRYLASINGADVYVDPFVSEQGDSIPLNPVARLPQVAKSERAVQLAVQVRSRKNKPIFSLGPNSIGWVLPTDDRRLDTIDRLKVLHGRLPNPAQPNEVIGDTKALSILGVHVGDFVLIRVGTQHNLDQPVFHLSSDPLRTHVGPLVRLRVVGVAANARADVDGGQMHLTPAFFHTYGERKLGAFIEEMVIRLKHGQADLPAFKAALAKFAGKRPYLLFEPSAGHPKIQHSIDLEARALWLVAGLGAIAAVILVGQALLRLAADESADDATLRALGADAGHQIGFAAARAALIAVPAVVVAGVVAFLLSDLAPIGWARELEPDTGLDFDAAIILPGLAVVLACVLAFGLGGGVRAVLSGAGRPAPVASNASPTGTRLIRSYGSPTFTAGLRMALGADSGHAARGTFVAAVVAITVSVTALTFAASFTHLTSTPRLYGQTWDYEAGFVQTTPPKLVASFAADPGITALGSGSDDTLAINGVETGVRAWDNLKGNIAPTMTAGRPPHGPSEIVLASKTLDATHAHVGGFVSVRGGGGVRRLHVVGRTVLPSSKLNKLGYGGILSFKALRQIDPAAQAGLQLIQLAAGPSGAAAQKRLNFYFDSNVVIKPDEVGDFGRIENMPLYIALLAIGAAAAALAHALVTRVRRGRRDLAVLKTLGFTRAQVAGTVAWEATVIVAAAVIVGLPLGVAIGRFTWRLFANDLGVAPEVVVPVLPVLLVVPVALVLANTLAAVPGWLAARIGPAAALRTE